jgi:hypothetical protein
MKFVKMSLAAAMLMGATAYAEVKTSGNAQLFYGTVDADNVDLFDKYGAFGNASASVDVEYKTEGGVVAKVGATFLSTLGLEHTLVEGIWAGNNLKDQLWIDEASLTFKATENTAMILGRQYIDTPLAFSETWNIVANSMDAAVVANSDIPDTTLVGAYVGRGNGTSGFQVVDNSSDLNLGGNYNLYGTAISPALANGAFAFGAVTSLVPMTTFQAWYYDVVSLATAYWLQADVDVADTGLGFGAQYASIDPDKGNTGIEDETTAYAFKIGFAPKDTGMSFSAAFSDVDEGNSPIQMANTATGAMGGAQSKLYTEAWWNFGYVGVSGTTAYNVAAEFGADIADFGAYFTSTSNDDADVEMTEVTLTVAKSFGALDASIAYIYTEADDFNDGDGFNDLQLYLTYNF